MTDGNNTVYYFGGIFFVCLPVGLLLASGSLTGLWDDVEDSQASLTDEGQYSLINGEEML